jgi:hypothetical protein
MNNIKYVGMDVHKSITVIVVLNELGQFESRSQIKTKGENICDFFRGISGEVEVVFEEGAHSADCCSHNSCRIRQFICPATL